MEENETNIPSVDTVEQIYDPATLENIKLILAMSLEADRPQSFEIEIDGLRVVPRTPVLEMFDTYKKFIHPGTRKIIVTVYRGVRTPACTKHVFIKEKPTSENLGTTEQQTPAVQQGYLSGTEVKQMMQDMLEKERMNNRIILLEEKLQERDKKLQEAEEYMSKLQNGIHTLQLEKDSKNAAIIDKLVDVAKNPPDWVKLMILKNTNEKSELSGTDQDDEETISESDQQHLAILRKMEEELDDVEIHSLMIVTDKLIDEPKLITDVAELLDVKLPE